MVVTVLDRMPRAVIRSGRRATSAGTRPFLLDRARPLRPSGRACRVSRRSSAAAVTVPYLAQEVLLVVLVED